MDRTQTTQILAYIKAAYPQAWQDAELARQAVAVWQDMFEDTPAEQVGAAVRMAVAGSRFPPSIAEVNDCLRQLREPEGVDGEEAWRLVKKAFRSNPDVRYTPGGNDYSAYFGKLPEDIRRVVGSARQFNIWGQMDEGELERFEKPRFLRGYEERRKARERLGRLPARTRAMLAEKNG